MYVNACALHFLPVNVAVLVVASNLLGSVAESGPESSKKMESVTVKDTTPVDRFAIGSI